MTAFEHWPPSALCQQYAIAFRYDVQAGSYSLSGNSFAENYGSWNCRGLDFTDLIDRFGRAHMEPAAKARTCTNCGFVQQKGSFCTSCGAALFVDSVPVSGVEDKPQWEDDEQSTYCIECGKHLKQNAEFCPNCGEKVECVLRFPSEEDPSSSQQAERSETSQSEGENAAPERQPDDDEALSLPINRLSGDCEPEKDKPQEKRRPHGGRKLIILLAAAVVVMGAAGLTAGFMRTHSETNTTTTEFVLSFSWPKSGLQETDVIAGIRGSTAAASAPLYLPKQLPAGFYVPRTYRALLYPANGNVVANPEVWGQPNAPGYGLCFSDGSHQILLCVNAAADAGEESWVDTGISIGGVAFKQVKGAAFLEANLLDGTKIDIDATGGALTGVEDLQQVLDIARSLMLVPTTA
jgi:predicted RNA-binding Zn-ribbon protein involved in translation (DUF1610 family)